MTFSELSKTMILSTVVAGTAALLVAAAATLAPGQAQAKPAFAQQTGKGCPTCHTAPPNLNGTGQKFKAKGYKF